MSKLHLPKNPTLNDTQQYVQEMLEERGFADQDVTKDCLLLTEEVGELFKTIRKSHASMSLDSNKQYDLNTAEELADVLIVLTSIANKLDINLEDAFRAKEEKNKQRTWQ
jgi:NTP pyrophosphatase (non-canonical NTP hydrolase)